MLVMQRQGPAWLDIVVYEKVLDLQVAWQLSVAQHGRLLLLTSTGGTTHSGCPRSPDKVLGVPHRCWNKVMKQPINLAFREPLYKGRAF